MITRRKLLQSILSSIPFLGLTTNTNSNNIIEGSIIDPNILGEIKGLGRKLDNHDNINLIKLIVPPKVYNNPLNKTSRYYNIEVELDNHMYLIPMYRSTLYQIIKNIENYQNLDDYNDSHLYDNKKDKKDKTKNIYYYPTTLGTLYGYIVY